MKLIIALIFIFSQQSAHAYTKEKIDLSPFEFLRYVKPQFNSIANEYRTLFFSINEDLKMYTKVFPMVDSLYMDVLKIKYDCSKLEKNCQDKIEALQASVGQLFDRIFEIQIENHNEVKDILLMVNHENIKGNILRLKIYLDLIATEFKVVESINTPTYNLINEVSNFYLNFHIDLLNHSDARVRNVFHAYWKTVIHPIKEHIFLRKDQDYFLRYIVDLNMTWNTLNMELTKRNFLAPKQAQTLLKIMHNRWNNILKVTLKN